MTEQGRAELPRKVAEELGYSVLVGADAKQFLSTAASVLVYPNGHKKALHSDRHDTVALAWEYWLSDLPDWTTSVDAAMTLPLSDKDDITVGHGAGTYVVAIETWDADLFVISRKIAEGVPINEQIASGVCEVWLEYRRAAKGEQS